ncbi:MAG: hypothetical protein V7K90_29175 [Nostoc sp.]|uniref:hypothetical protein n=1 Tax=Nostoc sp. TaxID=1180 RepID=UPI002FF9D62B
MATTVILFVGDDGGEGTAKNNLASWKQVNRLLSVYFVSGYTTLDANSKNCSQPFGNVSLVMNRRAFFGEKKLT